MSLSASRLAQLLCLGLAGAAWVTACGDQHPSTVQSPPFLAKSGPSGGTSDPTVNDVDPDTATVDTTLDVVVFGSGYDKGSQVTFQRGGIPAQKIRTNSTVFLNPKKLIANITIAADADTGAYDVAVMTSDGRKGIGIEMFQVKEEDVRAIVEYPTDDAALKIRSDHRVEFTSPDGQRVIYEDGVCGQYAKIFASGSGDAVMDPDFGPVKGRDKATCGERRFVTFIFDTPADGNPPPTNPTLNHGAYHIMMQLWQLPIGVEVEGQAGFNANLPCGLLRFKPEPKAGDPTDPNIYPGSDKVLALRLDAETWRVRTKPFPDNKGFCTSDSRLYHLPFELTVRVKP